MSSTESPIFIVGPGRSGTTLLQNMLRAHPRIYITHEAFFYLANRICSPRLTGRQFLDYYFHTWWFRWLRLDPDRILATVPDDLSRKDIGIAFAAIMREKAARFGRARFGDKTPGHAGCLAEIFADFPNARVLHVVRDPRDNVQSLQRMPWTPASLVFNALYLADERLKIGKYRDRILEVRLEDLLGEPRSTMVRVLDFIGEPWDDAVLDHARSLPDQQDIPPMPWHERATRDRLTKPERRQGLSPLDTRVVELLARRTMREAGYEPAKLDREPSRFAVYWTIIREIPELFRALAFGLRHGAQMRRNPATLDDPQNRAKMQELNPAAWAHYRAADLPSPPPLRRGVLGLPAANAEEPETLRADGSTPVGSDS